MTNPALNTGRGDKPRTTLSMICKDYNIQIPDSFFADPYVPQKTLFGIQIIYQESQAMPDHIPDEVLKKLAGTNKCADEVPETDPCDECCEDMEDD